MKKLLVGCLVLVFSCAGWAENSSHYEQNEHAQAMLKRLDKAGINADQARQILATAKHQESIIKAMKSPAESRLTWGQYRPIFLGQDRIDQGVDFIKKHQKLFAQTQKKYGVPASIIAAIIGVETRYGRHIGGYRVIDALATLAFDYPPRSKFFSKELENFLQLCVEEDLDCTEEKGSYAGAMGLPQFMPSSYRYYAVDGNQNGKRDLWNEPADIIASVANYLKDNGWQRGQPITAPIKTKAVEQLGNVELSHTHTHYKLGNLQNKGIHIEYNLADDTQVGILKFTGPDGAEYWLGLPNFFVITTYNRSPLYAMAVYQLSQEIKSQLAGE